jgi:hypothetical protein
MDILRNTSKAIDIVERSYVAIWYWIGEFDSQHLYLNKKKNRISAFILDETQIQIDLMKHGLWV